MVGLGLGLGLGIGSGARPNVSKGPICDAITAGVCISVVEKKHTLIIAPYVVYAGHQGAQQLDGVVVERDGKAPNKPKIDTFTVNDLSGVSILTDRPFTPIAGFDPANPDYAGKTVCIVNLV